MTVNSIRESLNINVSRETLDQLKRYEQLVRKWNPAINLVSKPSLVDFWERHIIDSVQIFPHIPSNTIKFLDIGSGGGLPAIVLAILSAELSPDRRFTLVESDQRKSAFLREAVRTLGLTAEILPVRAEALDPRGAEVLSARALAPLAKLLISAQRHLAEGGVCIFPKGESFRQEIAEAEAQFHFEYDAIPSMTDPRGAILKIHGIRNA